MGPVSPVPQASRLEVELAVTPGVPQAGKSRACRESGLTQTVRQDAPRSEQAGSRAENQATRGLGRQVSGKGLG